ncbi:MAG: GNAT family N-acetyltransferase [Myxococcota bacterium]
MNVRLEVLPPERFGQVEGEVARLRIEVFRDYPYLYDGSLEYERTYLAAYARSAEALWVVARAGTRIVGASTGLPLADEVEALGDPFAAGSPSKEDVFYFGESVLLPEFRGLGLGHRFFDMREAHAQRLGRYSHTAFAAVVRAQDHPRRPRTHRDLEPFWQGRGYRPSGRHLTLSWKEIDEPKETEKPLELWIRALPGPTGQSSGEA